MNLGELPVFYISLKRLDITKPCCPYMWIKDMEKRCAITIKYIFDFEDLVQKKN